MKKTLRTVVASLLLLVMLFSVSVTTIFAAGDTTSVGNGGTGAFDPITPPVTTPNGVDLGWISVQYDDDSLDIVWHHRFEAMLNTLATNPEVFKEFADILVAGFEHLVIDSLKGAMTGKAPATTYSVREGSGAAIDINDMEGLLKTSINSYLGLDPEQDDYIEKILEFFETLLGQDMSSEGSEAHKFSAYICELISLAVSSGALTLDELKAKIENGEALKAMINDKINGVIDSYATKFITDNVPVLIDKYVKELKNEPNDLPEEIKDLIEGVAVSFAKTQATYYLNGKPTSIDSTVIENFIFSQVETVLENLLPNYAKMKKNPGYKFWKDGDIYASAYQTAFEKVDEYVNRAIENYIKITCGITPENSTVLDSELQTNATVSEVFNNVISSELDKIVDYIEGGRVGEKPATYDIFNTALTSYFAETKITADMLTAEYAAFLDTNKTTFKTLFETQFDTELQTIITYIEGGRVGNKPANYDVFATLLSQYFASHNTIDTIPSSILVKYINSNKTTLTEKFGLEFDTEYAKVVAGRPSALSEILENAFDSYFTGKTFNDIDKSLVSEYLDLKGGEIKDEFVKTKLAEINVDSIINNIVNHVKAKANGTAPATAPDYYEDFKAAFNAKNFTYNSMPVTFEDAESNSAIADAIFSDENIGTIKAEFKASVETKVTEKVNTSWPEIVAYAKLENPTTAAPENYDVFVSEFNKYLAGNAIKFDSIGTEFLAKASVKAFIKEQVNFGAELDKIVAYLEGKAAKPESYDVFASVFDSYFASNAITLDNINADLIKDASVKTEIKNAFDFDTEYGNIVNYIKGVGEKPDSYEVFVLAFNAHFAGKTISLELIPSEIPLSFLESYVNDTAKKNALINKFKDTIKNADDKEAYYSKISAIVNSDGGILSKVSEESLNAMINSVSSDTIVSAVQSILKSDASYKASFISVVNGLADATIVGFLEKMVSADGFDTSSLTDEVNKAFFDEDGKLQLDDETYNAALELYLGLSKSDLDKGILDFEEVIAGEYDKTLENLANGGGSFEMADLIKYLKHISVNGEVLVSFANGTTADKAAIKKLLLESLPTFDKVANMSNEELKNLLHWEVEIATTFSVNQQLVKSNFDLNVSVGSNYSEVREFAAAMNELVTINREEGKVTLNLNLFDNFEDVLVDFINSDKISPALRSEIFGLMGLSLEDIYAYVSDNTKFTYAKYRNIISAIDFEKIFKNFGIENEAGGIQADYNALMLKVLCSDEIKFEQTRQSILDRISSVPESLKDKTIYSIYEGEGKFSYAKKVKIYASAVISKLSAALPALEDFTSMLHGIVGNRAFESELELNVYGPDLHKVTYVVTDPETGATVTKTGLLPDGIGVQGFFSPTEKYAGEVIERYNGYRIVKWSLSNGGDPVTIIPANDVTLYATLENIKSSISVYDNSGNPVNSELIAGGVEYNENKSYVLEASISYSQNTFSPELAYQWYKGTTPIIGANSKTLKLSGEVSSSGEYWCRVIIVSDGDMNGVFVDSAAQTVTVNRKAININEYCLEWNYDVENPFIYSGSTYSVTLTPDSLSKMNAKGLPALTATPIYINVVKIDAGEYLARAGFAFANVEDNANYVLVNPNGVANESGFAFSECEWTIEKKALSSMEGFKWSVKDGDAFTYEYGKTYSVTLTLPEGLTVESYVGATGTDADKYTTTATVKSSNPNYVWVGANPTVSWEIKPQLLDLSEIEWNYDPETPYVFSGEEKSVVLAGVPEDIVWIYTDNVATYAGSYVSSVELDPNNALNSKNYIFKGEAPVCEWTIEKQTVESLLELGWNYTEAFTYNGSAYSVELDLPEEFDERISVVYSENVATDAGSYTAKAELVALDADNFEVVGETISFECAWVINKAKADMSGISFSDKTVVETGAPIGIEIEGTLPAGITVQYSEPKVEVGEYEMKASFIYNENNFEPIAPMTATLTITRYYPPVNDFTNTDSTGTVIVDIKAQNEISSKDALNVKDLSTQYAGYNFGSFFGPGKEGKVLAVYDIHFAENGTETPINNNFTVKLLMPANFSGDINNVHVVHIAENGEITDMNAMSVDGNSYMAYDTTHFSVYAIVEAVDAVEDTKSFDLYSLIPYGVAALVVLLLLIIIIAIIKKKRKKSEPEEPKSEEVKPEEPKPEDEAEETVEEVEAETAEAEETVAEETEENTVSEEAPAEETPEEEKQPTLVIHDSVEDIVPEEPKEDGAEAIPLTNEIVHVRCRSSFTSRLIQSEPPIQDYYTILKNALLSYKGVKARMSFNFESFNSGRVQCAKLNVKGKSFLVYLGLDLDEYNVNKYHFSDASDKPKFEKVPMMLKVKSDRSLKYALELIEEVMKKNGFEKDPKFVEVDYHMPYETTAALAEKELIKLILPQGVSLAEGIKLVKTDVGALLDEAKSGDDEDDED